MRALVIGCGSIGTRRAKLLAAMGHEAYCWDSGDSATIAGRLAGYPFVSVSGPAQWASLGLDAAFVCTPAHTHLAVAREVIEAGCGALFIEKPLSTSMDGVAELVAECDRRGVVTMGACNMRWAYKPDAQLIDATGRMHLVSEQPLKDWRPGAEAAYRENGIMLEMAIHEMDLVASRLGPIVWLRAVDDGNGDEAIIHMEHADGGRSLVSVSWADRARTARYAVAGPGVYANLSDEMYRKEMAQFLRAASGEEPPTNPLREAAETLRWALRARDMTRKVAA